MINETRNFSPFGLAYVASTAACHKADAGGRQPSRRYHPSGACAAQSRPQPTPEVDSIPAGARLDADDASVCPQMTPQERATLNESLAQARRCIVRLRQERRFATDARTRLKADVGVIREILANYPNQKLLIEGHCDERGSEEYNMALGDRRAQAAEEFLAPWAFRTRSSPSSASARTVRSAPIRPKTAGREIAART